MHLLFKKYSLHKTFKLLLRYLKISKINIQQFNIILHFINEKTESVEDKAAFTYKPKTVWTHITD